MRSNASNGLFRTHAWAQAWLDTWGNDTRIEVIDLAGNNNPREMVYRTRHSLKKILPVNSLHLIGVGSQMLSTPRAEYNDIDAMISSARDNLFSNQLKKMSWSQFHLPDMSGNSVSVNMFKECAQQEGWSVHLSKQEPTYHVAAEDFVSYLSGLGPNTRLAYFNRRERLSSFGTIEFRRFTLEEMPQFFNLLNEFHLVRWGQKCYSPQSQFFLSNFVERLEGEHGAAVMESMSVGGQVVSVLFDIVLNGCRYNFQSGYAENKFPKIALGAIHMGYAIQSAIESGLIYDFMAGEGKHSNYKERISTHQDMIQSFVVERGTVKYLRSLRSRFG